MAVTYHVEISDNENGLMSYPVTNELFDEYGLTFDEFDKAATANSELLMPKRFGTIGEITGAPFSFTKKEDEMYILTNTSGLNGAASIFYNNVAKDISEDVFEGEDYYILPSSIHELILISTHGREIDKLEAMVRDVNNTVVEETDFLSDNVYRYNHETNTITFA